MTPETPDLSSRAEMAVFALGILLSVVTAYYAGRTGDWRPLMAVSVGMGLLVVFDVFD